MQSGSRFIPGKAQACAWPRRTLARRWCIIEAYYRCEATAESEISDGGYLVYVPRYKTRVRQRRNHRKWIDAVRPLFPGYLFVDCPHDASIGWLANRRGVRDVVRHGIYPALVPDYAIERLRKDEGLNFNQPYRSDGPASPFQVNDQVRITEGPFAGFYGTIGSLDRAQRITVFCHLFGRVTPVLDLEVDQLERVDPERC